MFDIFVIVNKHNLNQIRNANVTPLIEDSERKLIQEKTITENKKKGISIDYIMRNSTFVTERNSLMIEIHIWCVSFKPI